MLHKKHKWQFDGRLFHEHRHHCICPEQSDMPFEIGELYCSFRNSIKNCKVKDDQEFLLFVCECGASKKVKAK